MNHFEIDPSLGENVRVFVRIGRSMRVVGFKPHDMAALAGNGDEQRMNFLLRDCSLAITPANVADLG
jgi:hypothetical protein